MRVEAVAAAMPGRYRAAVLLAAGAGLRVAELFALQRGHIDLERGTVLVEVTLLERPGHPVSIQPFKSAAARRTVLLPGAAAEALAEHLATFTGPGSAALVFATEDGVPPGSAHRCRMFARACEAAGCPDLRWHDLRHTGAMLAGSGDAGTIGPGTEGVGSQGGAA